VASCVSGTSKASICPEVTYTATTPGPGPPYPNNTIDQIVGSNLSIGNISGSTLRGLEVKARVFFFFFFFLVGRCVRSNGWHRSPSGHQGSAGQA